MKSSIIIGFYLIFHCGTHVHMASVTRNLDRNCTNPINEAGLCVQLSSCRNLLRIFMAPPLSQLSKDFLRASQCGVVGKLPKVCCSISNVLNVTEHASYSQGQSIASRFGHDKPASNGTICGVGPQIQIKNNSSILESFDLPWIANIEYMTETGKGFHCDGVLISKRYILTAAHCIKRSGKRWEVVGVSLGEWNSNPPSSCTSEDSCSKYGVNYQVESTTVHELFVSSDMNRHNDIALLRLGKDVTFTDQIKPICLLTTIDGRSAKPNIGGGMYITGWKKNSNPAASDDLVSIRVEMMSSEQCRTALQETQRTPSEGQICDRTSFDDDICSDSSGGPLMFQDSRNGVGSWFVGGIGKSSSLVCRKSNSVATYTKVAHYKNWILSHMIN